jgi:hypothetical protein
MHSGNQRLEGAKSNASSGRNDDAPLPSTVLVPINLKKSEGFALEVLFKQDKDALRGSTLQEIDFFAPPKAGKAAYLR